MRRVTGKGDPERFPAAAPAPKPRRAVARCAEREERRPVFKEGVIRFASGATIPVVVKNTSRGGVRIDSAQRIPADERVLLSVPALSLKCWSRIVWRDERVAGLAFDPA